MEESPSTQQLTAQPWEDPWEDSCLKVDAVGAACRNRLSDPPCIFSRLCAHTVLPCLPHAYIDNEEEHEVQLTRALTNHLSFRVDLTLDGTTMIAEGVASRQHKAM